MKRFFPLIVFALLVAVLGVGLTLDPKKIPSPLIGKSAEQFTLPTLRDASKTVGSKQLEGKVTMLNVWATWCFACKQEHPILNQIAKSGVVDLYGLNWKDDRDKAIALLDQSGDPYTKVAFDEDGKVAIDFGVYGAPETFIIDKKGIIRHKVIGPISWQEWTDNLQPMINRLQAEL